MESLDVYRPKYANMPLNRASGQESGGELFNSVSGRAACMKGLMLMAQKMGRPAGTRVSLHEYLAWLKGEAYVEV